MIDRGGDSPHRHECLLRCNRILIVENLKKQCNNMITEGYYFSINATCDYLHDTTKQALKLVTLFLVVLRDDWHGKCSVKTLQDNLHHLDHHGSCVERMVLY
mmetsp:Transcript_6275/g.21469  ORF Transcript_6275/g.21469 Transcript_6275/m.21469 type:complete len:102 (-) Transcript_6275:1633-1938(-)